MPRSTPPRRLRPLSVALLAVAPLAATALSSVSGTAAPLPAAATTTAAETGPWFERLATYPVFQNVPAGVDPSAATVAEISAVSADGTTLAYTDALGGRIGFLDITDPKHPVGLGSHDVRGTTDDSPTSVSIVGDNALVVVDESTYPGLEDTPWAGEAPAPGVRGGRLDIVGLDAPHDLVASIDLLGQPDSIAISPDGTYAAIAIENQRNEAVAPADGDEGDLPQPPSGFVQVIDLTDPDPAAWTATPVTLSETDLAGLDTPQDAEPEYVDINADNQLALTLQENNGVVVIDLPTASVEHVWSAGKAQVSGIDTTKDGIFNPTGSIDLPREPDSIQWVGDGLVATANEGDWKGGTRGWTVFDAADGTVKWDAGNSFEQIATRHGLFNNDRAAKKGAEPEGLAFDEIGGTPYAFVGSERSNFVAVYDMTDPVHPAFVQALPTTNGPEGLLPIPGRDLLAVSSETDDASALVRSSVALYELGTTTPAFPSIVSADEDGTAIGWGALSALSPVPGDPQRVWAASDAAYRTGRIYSVDLGRRPAVIDDVLTVTQGGAPVAIDVEGIAARADGGFWLAEEGATGPANRLLRTDASGAIQETVSLPTDVAAGLGKWGLEGVTVTGSGAGETVYVALQRALTGETAPRIGRYQPATGQWTWFGYPLETTTVAGDWVGLSEITAVDADTLAIIERDKQNGTTAAIKRVYAVDVPATTTGAVTPLTKRLAVDLLPRMTALGGWTQEKLEGFTITAGGEAIAVADNDGLKDATGETQLFRLGVASAYFPAPPAGGPSAACTTAQAQAVQAASAATQAAAEVTKLKKKRKAAAKAHHKAKVAKLKKRLKKAKAASRLAASASSAAQAAAKKAC